MSIQDAIRKHEETDLFMFTSGWEGEETLRYVFVSKCVADFLWEPIESDKGLASRTRALIGDFIEAGMVTVGWHPHHKRDCMMARVDSRDAEYEIWDFRLTPRPGVRLLGGFTEKNVFVCLTWDYRDNFEGHWPEKIDECIAEWQRLFGDCKPLRKGSVDEYISPPFDVV